MMVFEESEVSHVISCELGKRKWDADTKYAVEMRRSEVDAKAVLV